MPDQLDKRSEWPTFAVVEKVATEQSVTTFILYKGQSDSDAE